MREREYDADVVLLHQAILKLQTIDECDALFEDLCTINELKSMVQRLAVARMLYAKKTYTEISRDTGASAATISRVNKALEYGTGGYRTILKRLEDDEQ